jgi:hypothetical protein
MEVYFSLADFSTKSFISKKFNFISNASGYWLSAKTEKVIEFEFFDDDSVLFRDVVRTS